ncbi:phosphonate metabolism transcriptional regulator PhnF [Mesorhizobium onobrychidis]|uniref:Phosphonate metabolism transcriptional regulator PhnF n=1 Tax=Mesorhizobium onobrychidis TaxID=2775404 RepID=A0ABY5QVX7_9HYPH|nr:phosphonate metabolism transcriptional regulator PhnF [Mesorhizobium onobrychidis]UVC15183.1 phosphonate metabolism transcriptional regulator PhnF [Mesorhizobium onobrychidis]
MTTGVTSVRNRILGQPTPFFPNEAPRGGRRPGPVVWKQIEEWLVGELTSGRYPPGTKLPTEPELIAQFGVGRHTLRQAMAMLEANGLVRIEQGRGTFVHDSILHYRLSERSRFTENLQRLGREPRYALRSVEECEATEEVSNFLRIGQDAPVFRLNVDSLSGEVIIANSDLYFCRKRLPQAASVFRELKSISAIYAQAGVHEYKRGGTKIRSRLPTNDEARRLNQPKSRPILVTKKTDVALDGTVLGYSETRWCADRVEFCIEPEGEL